MNEAAKQYNDRLRNFKNLCRYYKLNQIELKRLESQTYKYRSDVQRQFYEFERDMLLENISSVDQAMASLTAMFSEEAAKVFWDSYIECMPQDEVAAKYFFSVRTLQRMLGKWMREVLPQ